jgi:hypothetical protein
MRGPALGLLLALILSVACGPAAPPIPTPTPESGPGATARAFLTRLSYNDLEGAFSYFVNASDPTAMQQFIEWHNKENEKGAGPVASFEIGEVKETPEGAQVSFVLIRAALKSHYVMTLVKLGGQWKVQAVKEAS